MDWFGNSLRFVVESILAEIIVVAAGVLFAHYILNRWEQWRYGGWKVFIRRGGEQHLKRDISPGKVKEILAESSELSVFLKGVASPYAWIKCDLIEEGQHLGLLTVDRENRRFIIDLSKNPGTRENNRLGEDPEQ